MKKLYLFAVAFSLFALQACSQEQAKWVEGTHYQVIRSTATQTPEITEYFSFWCPHCFAFEPIVAKLKSGLDSTVEFKKVHVNFMRFTTQQIQNDATRALVVARQLGIEEKMIEAIFKYIHITRGSVTGFNDLRDLFIANGVAPEDFDKVATSFNVNSQLMKNNNTVDEFKANLNGVPNFIVNGKYQATFTKGMTNDDVVELLIYLTQLK